MRGSEPLVITLDRHKIELDQRLLRALSFCNKELMNDGQLFLALYRTNCVLTRHLDFNEEHLQGYTFYLPPNTKMIAPDDVIANAAIHEILKKAISIANDPTTLGTRDFIRSIIELSQERGDDYTSRPFTLDLLAAALTGDLHTKLADPPLLQKLLAELRDGITSREDYQYILTYSEGRVAFRIVSVLDDYVQQSDKGIYLPQRALLTHFKDQFGGFTQSEIEELEELLNSRTAREYDFQSFFEQHTHFLRKWDYREVYPQVTLARSEGSLIPDFLLTDRELQRAAILDLKLPTPKLIKRQRIETALQQP